MKKIKNESVFRKSIREWVDEVDDKKDILDLNVPKKEVDNLHY